MQAGPVLEHRAGGNLCFAHNAAHLPLGRPCLTRLPLCCRFPDYGYGGRIDELHSKEVQPRLGEEHYLDFTGSGGL